MPSAKPLTNLLGKAISEAADKVPSIGGKQLPEAGSLLAAMKGRVPNVNPMKEVFPSSFNRLSAEVNRLGDLYDTKYDFAPHGLDHLDVGLRYVNDHDPALLANKFFAKDPLTHTSGHPEWSERFNKLFTQVQPAENSRYVAIGPNPKNGDVPIHEYYAEQPADFWATTYDDKINWGKNVKHDDWEVKHTDKAQLASLPVKQIEAILNGEMGNMRPADATASILGQYGDKQLASNVVNNMDKLVAYNRYNEMPENIQKYTNALSNYYGKAMPSQAMAVSVNPHTGKTNTLIPQYMYDINVETLLEPGRLTPGAPKLKMLEDLRPYAEGKISIRATDDISKKDPAYVPGVADEDDVSVRMPFISGLDAYHHPSSVVAQLEKAPDAAKDKWRDAALTSSLIKKVPSEDFLMSRFNDLPAHSDFTYRSSKDLYNGDSADLLHEAIHAMNPPNLTRLIINGQHHRKPVLQSGFKNDLSYIGTDQGELLRGLSMNKLPILSELMQEAPGIMKKHFSDVPENIRQQVMEELITRAALNPDVILSRYNRYGILPNRQYRFGKKDNNTIRIPEQYMNFAPGVLQEIARSTTGVNRSALGPARPGAKGDTDAVATLKRLSPQLFGIAGAVPATTFMVNQAQNEDSVQ